jgi:hypothetical protein
LSITKEEILTIVKALEIASFHYTVLSNDSKEYMEEDSEMFEAYHFFKLRAKECIILKDKIFNEQRCNV